jgi:membrane-bound lytic murein transglycosylase F
MNPNARSWVGARGIMQAHAVDLQGHPSRAVTSIGSIDDPEWNIAAGIMHDRSLWRRWERDSTPPTAASSCYASYNAGEGTIMNAQRACVAKALDQRSWSSVEAVAPNVPRWRYRERSGRAKDPRRH